MGVLFLSVLGVMDTPPIGSGFSSGLGDSLRPSAPRPSSAVWLGFGLFFAASR